MMILWYVSGLIAIIATVCVIVCNNPIYALLYLIGSLLSTALNLFSLRATFAGVIEIIIYAGAIMVLFVFVVMMLNFNRNNSNSSQFSIKNYVKVVLISGSLWMMLLCSIFNIRDCFINIFESEISVNKIGIILFGPYMLVVEMASFVLLGALISVLHISQEYNMSNNSVLNLVKDKIL